MSDSTSPVDGLPIAVVTTIKAERAARDIPVGELTRRVGISPRTMTRYLNGSREMSLSMIDRFARALGMSLPDLIRLAEKRLENN